MKRHDAGFTLLELLVAMTLLALLMVVLFAGLRFGAKAWDKSQASGTNTEDVRLVQSLVTREIEAAYPGFIPGLTPKDGTVDFDGAETRLAFLAPGPQSFGGAGRARVALERRRDGVGWQLVMTIRPELAADGTPVLVEPLLSHLAGVRFAYAADASNPLWLSGWSQQRVLPALVRVEIAFPSGDARRWSGLIVAPRISADANCVYDASTKTCQDRG